MISSCKTEQDIPVADTGGLQWFQLKPPLKERAPLIRDDWYREEQKSP